MEAFEPQCPTPEASAPYVGHHLGLEFAHAPGFGLVLGVGAFFPRAVAEGLAGLDFVVRVLGGCDQELLLLGVEGQDQAARKAGVAAIVPPGAAQGATVVADGAEHRAVPVGYPFPLEVGERHVVLRRPR